MFKSSSVKKLLLLAVAPDMSENSHNLSQILNLLGVEAIEDVTGDIKYVRKSNVFNQHIYFFKFDRWGCSW